jgi:uncharacterized tellurite resistance protein B-like protein
MSDVLQRLKDEGRELTSSVLEAMYRNPFWEYRFGERGRRHSNEDGDYHLQYLEEAYIADDPQIFVSYVRWLRSVLTSRGMTSRHLAENFSRLRVAIQDRFGAEGEKLVALLEAGERALIYESGPAMTLQLQAEVLAEDALELLADRTGAQALRAVATPGITAKDLACDLLSYAADAIASGRPEIFHAYRGLIRSMLAERGIAGAELDELIAALREVIQRNGELRPVSALLGSRRSST